ncbi:hypothetical protein B0H14DRAFT_3653270 [Mycena olivaceomarginata]|nr:hypothetical protein B0H14DRAFT_3653270 [Mycena olivaceomarginata]
MVKAAVPPSREMNKIKPEDARRCSDRTLRRVLGFRGQLRAITDAYMKWGANQSGYGLDETAKPLSAAPGDIDGVYRIKVVDIFIHFLTPRFPGTYNMDAPMRTTDEFTASCLLAITTRVLEIFCVARLRCPTLSIQGWVKTLCDLHSSAYIPYLSQQSSISYDLYLETLKTVDERVPKALGRDMSNWRLRTVALHALDLIDGAEALSKTMLEMGIEDASEFAHRLEAEQAYLKGLCKEPETERIK